MQANAIDGDKMATLDERIATLEEKLKQQKAKKQQLEDRKKTIESKKRRTQENRKKVLVGAIVLARVERGDWPEAKLMAMLDAALVRKDERALFSLPPKPETDTSAQHAPKTNEALPTDPS